MLLQSFSCSLTCIHMTVYCFYITFSANVHQITDFGSYLMNCTVRCIGMCVTFDLVQLYEFWCEAIKANRVKVLEILSTHRYPSFYNVNSGCWCEEEVSVYKKLYSTLFVCFPPFLHCSAQFPDFVFLSHTLLSCSFVLCLQPCA